MINLGEDREFRTILRTDNEEFLSSVNPELFGNYKYLRVLNEGGQAEAFLVERIPNEHEQEKMT